MEWNYIGEREDTKYNNHNRPLYLDSIPNEDLEEALKDFSEGSLELMECLRILWSNNIKTFACCKGDHVYLGEDSGSTYGEAYICMEEGYDAFSYLSEGLINNEMIELYDDHNKQTIYFYGKDKNNLIKQFGNDVLTGKKNNMELLKEKIGKSVSNENLIESLKYRLKVNNFSDNEIEKLINLFKTDTYEFQIEFYAYILKNNKELEDKNNPMLEDKKSSRFGQIFGRFTRR